MNRIHRCLLGLSPALVLPLLGGCQERVGKEERAYVLAVVLLLLATGSLFLYRLMLKRALRWFS